MGDDGDHLGVAADKPKPPNPSSAPPRGFDGYDMSMVRERQPEWQQRPQGQQPSPVQQQQSQWGAAPMRARSPRVWLLAAIALCLAVGVVIVVTML